MSQPALGQSQRNEPIGGDSDRTQNGIENTNHDGSAHIDAPRFGIFHDQVQHEVQRLQGGLDTVGDAIAELTRTFGKYGKIVEAVGSRWGQDRVLEEKIHNLEVANDGIWKHVEKDRDEYKRDISNLKREHEVELSELRAQANAGKQEKEKYEEMERLREDTYNKAIQDMDIELKQTKTQLEQENAEKIATLGREKRELEDAKAKLEQDLKERTEERDKEMETRKTIQDKLRKDIRELQNTISDTKAKYQVEKQPLQFYSNRYQTLTHSVGKIATLYFTNLPDKAIDDPVRVSARLCRRAPSFAKIPIADSECSQVLRLANVQHVIFDVICGSLWQPFFSKYLWKCKQDMSTFTKMHSHLVTCGEDVQQNWKVSTLKSLGHLDDAVDVGEQIDNLIAEKVIGCLQPLLDDSQTDQFKNDLRVVFIDALELGKMAERDQSMVYIDNIPSASDQDGWKEYLSDEYETSDASDLSATSPTIDTPLEPLFVSPKIFRRAATAIATTSATATATTAATTTTASRPEVEIIQQGFALFPSTGIFQDGASDWQRISNAGRDVARNINGRARRQSMSASMTSSVIMPRSPTQPSKRWLRDRAQDFD